jgi:glycine reductase
VISKELDRAGVPVAIVTAMYPLAEQVGASRIIRGVRIPHPCGDPNLPPEVDARLRKTIVKTALDALKTDVPGPTHFVPNMSEVA